jgi:ABC-type uncharacterized transport system permease subunit
MLYFLYWYPEAMYSDLLWLAVVFYGLGIVLALPSAARGRPTFSPAAFAAVVLGLVLNGAALVIDAQYLRRIPLTGIETALSFLGFCIAAAFLFVSRTYRPYGAGWLGALLLPLVFLLTLGGALGTRSARDVRVLADRWLIIHSTTMILGYTCLFLTSAAAVMYLMQAGELKSKRPRSFYRFLPPLEVCDRLYDHTLIAGVLLLTAGIATGFLWASRMWKGSWELDPKILASVVTWVIYVVLGSTRLYGKWKGRKPAYVAIIGFAAVMVTFLGATFLSSQHGFFPR